MREFVVCNGLAIKSDNTKNKIMNRYVFSLLVFLLLSIITSFITNNSFIDKISKKGVNFMADELKNRSIRIDEDTFSKFKEIQESTLDELNRANASLVNENKKLASENSKLKEDLAILNEKMNNANYKIGILQATLEARNNNSNLISVDLVEMIEKLETIADSYESAIKAAEHKAAMKTFNKRVASGDVKPAKRADISDEYIIENVKNGISAYKIAQSVGMTQQAILYRIKKLKENGLI